MKVRSCEVTPVIDVEYNTNGTATAQSVTLNRADIVLAGNGEIVREENIEYVQQSFDVTVQPKSLTFSIDTTNMKEGTYDPSSVLKIDGLVDGNEITYGEDVVVSALPQRLCSYFTQRKRQICVHYHGQGKGSDKQLQNNTARNIHSVLIKKDGIRRI